jgi:hypothetical protein
MAVISMGLWSEALGGDRLDAEFFDPEDIALIKHLNENGGGLLERSVVF